MKQKIMFGALKKIDKEMSFKSVRCINDDFDYIFYHNLELINWLIDIIYSVLNNNDVNKDVRTHVLYFLKGCLELQDSIFSSFKEGNYLVMLSLIRVHIENLFHALWLLYNAGKISFDQKIVETNYWDTFLYKAHGKKYGYNSFIKQLLKDKYSDEIGKKLFGFDFLSKFVHGSGLYSVGKFLEDTGKNDRSNINKFYQQKGLNYIIFLQFCCLSLIKKSFDPTKKILGEVEIGFDNDLLYQNLDITLDFLDLSMNTLDDNKQLLEDIEYFKEILNIKELHKPIKN